MEYENQVLLGNCLHVLRELPDCVFDACVTDVPYGLGKKEPKIEEIIAYLQGADLDTGGDFMGKDWQIPSVLVWREVYRVLKPGGHVLSFGGTRTWDLISVGLRAAGFESRDTIKGDHPGLAWIQGQGMPKGANLKPTWEPIAVFRKPFKGSAIKNEEKYGTGRLQIDPARVKHANKDDFEEHKKQVEAVKAKGGVRGNSWKNSSDLSGANDVKEEGRWPPNAVFVHTPACVKSLVDETWVCQPGCPVYLLDQQSGIRPSMLTGRADPNVVHRHPGSDASSKSAFLGERTHLSTAYADTGGASRFFPQFESDPDPFFYTGKATKSETTLEGEIENEHPTKKPVALMRWLCRLAAKKGALILDPYCGSGSTLHAAIMERMRFTGIELNTASHLTSTERVRIVQERTRDKHGQQGLFEEMLELGDE